MQIQRQLDVMRKSCGDSGLPLEEVNVSSAKGWKLLLFFSCLAFLLLSIFSHVCAGPGSVLHLQEEEMQAVNLMEDIAQLEEASQNAKLRGGMCRT